MLHPNTVFGAKPDLIITLEANRHQLTVQDDGLGTQIWTIGLFQIPSGTITLTNLCRKSIFIAIFFNLLTNCVGREMLIANEVKL